MLRSLVVGCFVSLVLGPVEARAGDVVTVSVFSGRERSAVVAEALSATCDTLLLVRDRDACIAACGRPAKLVLRSSPFEVYGGIGMCSTHRALAFSRRGRWLAPRGFEIDEESGHAGTLTSSDVIAVRGDVGRSTGHAVLRIRIRDVPDCTVECDVGRGTSVSTSALEYRCTLGPTPSCTLSL
jgi:hypothetical protein